MGKDNDNTEEITRDIVGIFFNSERLQVAINNLTLEGVDPSNIGILSSEEATRDKLSDIYSEVSVAEDPESSENNLKFSVKDDTVATAPYATIGGLSLVATAVGGGAIVASAGLFGGAIAVATAASTVAVGLGAVATAAISQSDKDKIQQELDAGHILLWVRTKEDRTKCQAYDVLKATSEVEPILMEAGA